MSHRTLRPLRRPIPWCWASVLLPALWLAGVPGQTVFAAHAKLALVLRREEAGLQFYAHLGTGNYHLTTTRLYTDFGLLTAREEICSDVNEVFKQLTGLGKAHTLKHLWQAPFTLQQNVVAGILAATRSGGTGSGGFGGCRAAFFRVTTATSSSIRSLAFATWTSSSSPRRLATAICS